jgi:hypothetical protein
MPAILLANVVNGTDIRVVQCRSGLGFALKTGQSLRVTGNFIGQELEGYEAVEAHVLSLVDHTHATAAQLLHNAVVRDGLVDQRKNPAPCATIVGASVAPSQCISGKHSTAARFGLSGCGIEFRLRDFLPIWPDVPSSPTTTVVQAPTGAVR